MFFPSFNEVQIIPALPRLQKAGSAKNLLPSVWLSKWYPQTLYSWEPQGQFTPIPVPFLLLPKKLNVRGVQRIQSHDIYFTLPAY